MNIRLVKSSRGYYRYNEDTDTIEVFQSSESAWTQGIIDGAGLDGLTVKTAVVIEDFPKSDILYKAIPLDTP